MGEAGVTGAVEGFWVGVEIIPFTGITGDRVGLLDGSVVRGTVVGSVTGETVGI